MNYRNQYVLAAVIDAIAAVSRVRKDTPARIHFAVAWHYSYLLPEGRGQDAKFITLCLNVSAR